jgi:hypothetical protein
MLMCFLGCLASPVPPNIRLLRLTWPFPAADYAPPAFQARALQHTSVQLTWDADDDTRRRALTRRLNADELKEDDFRASKWATLIAY